MIKIIVASIAKNEENKIDSWYQSVKEADTVVVLDTGSTDTTIDKLKSKETVKVFQKHYDFFRFDEVRNDCFSFIKSLKLNKEDNYIICWLDLDEVLEPGWSELLKKAYREGNTFYKARYEQIVDGEYLGTAIDTRFANYDESLNWKFPIHEELVYNNTSTSNTLYLKDLVIKHDRETSYDRNHYQDLLRMRVFENSNNEDLMGVMFFIRDYSITSDEDVKIKLYLLDFLIENANIQNSLDIKAWALYTKACFLMRENYILDAEILLRECIKLVPGYLYPYNTLYILYKMIGKEREASEYKSLISTVKEDYSWLNVPSLRRFKQQGVRV